MEVLASPIGIGSVLRRRRAAAVVGATLLVWPLASSPRTQQAGRSTPAVNWEGHPTWSPDGRRVALESDRAGNVDIVIRDVATGADTPLTTDLADDTEPNWAPTGECVAFRSERDGGGLYVQCGTGAAHRVATDGHGPRWSPDGARLLYTTHGEAAPALHVVGRDGGASTAILGALTATLVGTVRAVWTQDARIAVIGTHPELGAAFWLLPEDAREATPPAAKLSRLLVRMRSVNPPPFELSRDGTAVLVTGRQDNKATLFRLPIDARTGALRGAPEPIAEWIGERSQGAIAPSGTRLAWALERQGTRLLVVPFDQASATLRLDQAERVGPDDGEAVFPDFSPDGGRLLYTVLREKGSPELRLWTPGSRTDVLLAGDGAFRFGPRWTPDGKGLSYRWHGSNAELAVSALRIINLTTGREGVVTSTAVGTPFTAFGWSPDGQHVLASAQKMDGTVTLVSLPMTAAPKAERKARTLAGPRGYKLWQATTSPNGRWILVNMQPANDAWSSIAVVPSEGGDHRRLTTDDTAWDDKPRWSADGRTVFFLSRRSGEFELWRIGFDPDTGQPVGSASRVSSLTSPRRHVLRGIGVLDLGLSASRLAVPVEETRSTLTIGELSSTPTGAPLTLCASKEPLADAAMPVDTDGVTQPLVQKSVQPSYPDRALQQGIAGIVTVETLVGVDGMPRPVCVVEKLDRDLEASSLSTVRRWRFTPAQLRGKPVAVLVTIALSYNIGRQP